MLILAMMHFPNPVLTRRESPDLATSSPRESEARSIDLGSIRPLPSPSSLPASLLPRLSLALVLPVRPHWDLGSDPAALKLCFLLGPLGLLAGPFWWLYFW